MCVCMTVCVPELLLVNLGPFATVAQHSFKWFYKNINIDRKYQIK